MLRATVLCFVFCFAFVLESFSDSGKEGKSGDGQTWTVAAVGGRDVFGGITGLRGSFALARRWELSGTALWHPTDGRWYGGVGGGFAPIILGPWRSAVHVDLGVQNSFVLVRPSWRNRLSLNGEDWRWGIVSDFYVRESKFAWNAGVFFSF
ncbi:hypothetical protein FUAX_45930 (plasmid) [Fulvitalea axinellae]|uniref:Uncharacterized protein n=2 Tax=Fulvitalea axinellae TaxID=1182444 RepID=A0AAU9DGA6_9BACT|nr:hypothetical protein FUAX_45930 [Fulvitalea axinellae]